MTLNAEQRAVVDHRGGHALVQAVAGSGKTATLVARVAALVDEDPATIARAVMFNRDAAVQFSDRVRQQAPTHARVKAQTFHSLGYALTQYLVRAGWLEPAVIETGDGWLLEAARRALRSAKVAFHGGRQVQVSRDELNHFVQFYERLCGDLREPGEVRLEDDAEYFEQAATALEQERRAEGVRGYAHLLRDPLECLIANPDARAAITDRIDELIVDEFQDVNAVQYELLRVLAGTRARVVICGDPDQTIYAWRGARLEFITERFPTDFHPVTTYRISHTQRYGHEIAALASHLIRYNRRRPDTLCVSAPGTPASSAHRICAEPGTAGDAFDRVVAGTERWSDVGILCRLWSLAVPYQIECLRRGIPYTVEPNRPRLGSDSTMRGLLAVLRIAAGRFPEQDRERRQDDAKAFLNLPPLGIDADAIDQISRRVAEHPARAEAEICEATRHSGSRAVHEAITSRAQLWSTLQSPRWRGAGARAVLDHHQRMTEHLATHTEEQAMVTRHRQIWCAVVSMADRQGGSAAEFADKLSSLTEREDRVRRDPPTDALFITTMHAAKGLQWDTVVLPGLAERAVPATQHRAADIEAERRLFYVALTRARRTALLVTPPDSELDEYIGRRRPDIPRTPHASRFVYEAAPGWELARVVRGESDQLVARDPDCARRYLEALGFDVAAPA